MPLKESKAMLIRVPIEIVEAAEKFKKEENLPTMGTAIKYWVEQQINEKTQLDISGIQKQQNKLFEMQKQIIEALTKVIDNYSASEAWAIKANKKANTIALSLESKELIKEIEKIDKQDMGNIQAVRNEQKKRIQKKLGKKEKKLTMTTS